MTPSREQIDALYREEVEGARQMSDDEKFLAGPRLFEFACETARAGIRMQFPEATPDEIERELQRRLDLGRDLENRE